MKKATFVAAAGVVGVLAASAVYAGSPSQAVRGSDNEIMSPGHGLSLEIGGKHVIGYFEAKNEACHLTVVLADANGGESGTDSPGTRFVVAVLPGRALNVDASAGRSAEFFCGPGASQMSARVFDRSPYKS
jgi:hypothetical protein